MTQKNESSLKLDFKQQGPTRGDCCAAYSVKLSRACTLQELIAYILTQRHSWGFLRIKGNLFSCFEYRYGLIIGTAITKVDLCREVSEVTADGGWSRMDYFVTLA